MVQMSSSDQAIIKAMPGNDKCMECGMKGPQWASVSFGTLFCLECSGVHRGLGVHISFVRSVAMDSWTNPQLEQMKTGGNQKCAEYLSTNGVSPSTSIKVKYNSPVAQHYKEVLKARVKGLPDPPLPATPKPTVSTRAAAAGAPGEDANGMERLTGETDEQYVARQTRLREEARARMAAKFGKGGFNMNSSSNGMGRKPMAGIGSDSSYDPSRGGYGGGGNDFNVDSLVSGIGSAFATFGEYGRTGIQSAATVLNDQEKLNDLANRAKVGAGGLWSTISSAANDLASTITEPDEGDGLSGLRAHVQHNKPTTSTKVYEGFGGGGEWSNGTTTTTNNASQLPMALNKKSDYNGPKKAKPTMPSSDDFFANFGA